MLQIKQVNEEVIVEQTLVATFDILIIHRITVFVSSAFFIVATSCHFGVRTDETKITPEEFVKTFIPRKKIYEPDKIKISDLQCCPVCPCHGSLMSLNMIWKKNHFTNPTWQGIAVI